MDKFVILGKWKIEQIHVANEQRRSSVNGSSLQVVSHKTFPTRMVRSESERQLHIFVLLTSLPGADLII